MSKNLEKKFVRFDLHDYVKVYTPPEEIVKMASDDLTELTKGNVIARVNEYKGSALHDFYQMTNNFILTLAGDTQSNLGSVGSAPEIFKSYEFYLTSPHAPNYMFRIMFFNYVLGQYPISIILDEGIGENLSCATEDEFTETLIKIINSQKVQKVVRALNALAQEEESENNSLEIDANHGIQKIPVLNS